MPPPCGHERPKEHAGSCHFCLLFTTHDGYQRLWGDPVTVIPVTAPKRELPCLYRGPDVRDERGRPVTKTSGFG